MVTDVGNRNWFLFSMLELGSDVGNGNWFLFSIFESRPEFGNGNWFSLSILESRTGYIFLSHESLIWFPKLETGIIFPFLFASTMIQHTFSL